MSEPAPSEANSSGEEEEEETSTNEAELAKIVKLLTEIMTLCHDNQQLTRLATNQLQNLLERVAPGGSLIPRKAVTSKKMMVEIEKKYGLRVPVRFLREFTSALSSRRPELKALKQSFRRDDLFKLLDENPKLRNAFFDDLKEAWKRRGPMP